MNTYESTEDSRRVVNVVPCHGEGLVVLVATFVKCGGGGFALGEGLVNSVA